MNIDIEAAGLLTLSLSFAANISLQLHYLYFRLETLEHHMRICATIENNKRVFPGKDPIHRTLRLNVILVILLIPKSRNGAGFISTADISKIPKNLTNRLIFLYSLSAINLAAAAATALLYKYFE